MSKCDVDKEADRDDADKEDDDKEDDDKEDAVMDGTDGSMADDGSGEKLLDALPEEEKEEEPPNWAAWEKNNISKRAVLYSRVSDSLPDCLVLSFCV